MKQRYSYNYYPAAPILNVRLAVPNGERVGPMPALIDTGSDGTVIPLEYLLDILAPSTDEMLSGVTGAKRVQYTFIWWTLKLMVIPFQT
jgi:hypothetical protein